MDFGAYPFTKLPSPMLIIQHLKYIQVYIHTEHKKW